MKKENIMKERPIIMGADSVMAILGGRKTQTRRVVKPQPIHMPEGAYIDPYNHNYEHFTAWTLDDKMLLNCGGNIKNTAHWKCPYGVIGDRLWVRESWASLGFHEDNVPIHVLKDNDGIEHDVVYSAECPDFEWLDENGSCEYNKNGTQASHWKSPMFMPRWASRITLEITAIRVERLQDITEDDAIKEGFHNYGTEVDTLDAFCEAWQSLNAKRGYPWESNPWVWVVSFKVVQK